jgi:hypothetical protein
LHSHFIIDNTKLFRFTAMIPSSVLSKALLFRFLALKKEPQLLDFVQSILLTFL